MIATVVALGWARSSMDTWALVTIGREHRSCALLREIGRGNLCLVGVTARQHAKHMRRALRFPPSDRESRTCQKLLADRDDLLANENAEQTHQRDQRRQPDEPRRSCRAAATLERPARAAEGTPEGSQIPDRQPRRGGGRVIVAVDAATVLTSACGGKRSPRHGLS
jgi:hypothetical protein